MSSTSVNNDNQVLVYTTIGNTLPFCRSLEAFGTVSSTIPITFNANGISIVVAVEDKKKKNNLIYLEARFHSWNTHLYHYASDAPKEICLKFDKTTLVERLKPIKQHEFLGLKVKRNVQAIYTLINEKGDDKLPAIIESGGTDETSIVLPAIISSDNNPLGWNSRKDYVDLCTAIKRASPCQVRMDIYANGINFVVIRYATKDGLPYKAGNVTGEKKASYNIDPAVFTLINTKLTKIVEELATIKFYILPKGKDTSSTTFITEMPTGVSGVIRIYYSAELTV